eukprot:Nk52_evm25s2325 gene=Nk52_evmTU25s2325
MTVLTEEQKKRIESNRQAALLRLQKHSEKKKQQTVATLPSSFHNHTTTGAAPLYCESTTAKPQDEGKKQQAEEEPLPRVHDAVVYNSPLFQYYDNETLPAVRKAAQATGAGDYYDKPCGDSMKTGYLMEDPQRDKLVKQLREIQERLFNETRGSGELFKEFPVDPGQDCRVGVKNNEDEGWKSSKTDYMNGAGRGSSHPSNGLRFNITHCVMLDFEAQFVKDEKRFPTEIVEFPAAVLDLSTGGIVGEFRSYVRPVVTPVLTKDCVELTGIKQSKVDHALTFPEVLPKFMAWLNLVSRTFNFKMLLPTDLFEEGDTTKQLPIFRLDPNYEDEKDLDEEHDKHPFHSSSPAELPRKGLFCQWNNYDLTLCFPRQCKLASVNPPEIFRIAFDVKMAFRDRYDYKSKTYMLQDLHMKGELVDAIKPPEFKLSHSLLMLFGLRKGNFIGSAHTGLDDCRNTCRVLYRLHKDGYLSEFFDKLKDSNFGLDQRGLVWPFWGFKATKICFYEVLPREKKLGLFRGSTRALSELYGINRELEASINRSKNSKKPSKTSSTLPAASKAGALKKHQVDMGPGSRVTPPLCFCGKRTRRILSHKGKSVTMITPGSDMAISSRYAYVCNVRKREIQMNTTAKRVQALAKFRAASSYNSSSNDSVKCSFFKTETQVLKEMDSKISSSVNEMEHTRE